MPEFRPFKGIRFSQEEDLSNLIAPPYDVISPEEREHLKSLSPNNVVRLILPEEEDGMDRYDAARRLVDQWMERRILKEDDDPSLYVLEQVFTANGAERRRFEVLGGLELSEFGEGKVLPHERTLSGPKADRLRLISATGMNLSPIFALFPDADGGLVQWFRGIAGSRKPGREARSLDGTVNRLFVVSDAALIDELALIMAHSPVLIADGHHRYETALNRRNELGVREQQGHPANYILTAVGSMEDPGMVILPTHRVISGTGRAENLIARLEKDCDVEPSDTSSMEALAGQTERKETGVFGLLNSEGCFLLTYRRDCLPTELAPGHPLSYRRLDVAILHAMMEKHLGIDQVKLAAKEYVSYVRSVGEAQDAVGKDAECAFILRPTLMQEVQAVARDGFRMPQKSTYFHPKIPSGLVLRRAT